MKEMVRVQVKGIIIHHSYSPDSKKANDWAAIKKYHTSWRYDGNIITEEKARDLISQKVKGVIAPWKDIGYHAGQEYEGGVLVRRIGRPESMNGAHCAEELMNRFTLGYCMVGCFDKVAPTDEELLMCAKWCAEKIKQYKIQGVNKIESHHKYANYKSCPGTAFPMDKLRELTDKILKS
jgi:hypothetical protein